MSLSPSVPSPATQVGRARGGSLGTRDGPPAPPASAPPHKKKAADQHRGGVRSSIKAASADFMASVVAGSLLAHPEPPAPGPAAAEKEGLSVQATTANFKAFVTKAGPIFWLQDRIEDIFLWKEPPITVFYGAIWACCCLFPNLFILLPNFAVIAILLTAHPRRFPSAHEQDLEGRDERGPPAPKEATEGSVDYLANLQNIQNMMGRVSVGSDVLRARLVPLLNWSDPVRSTVLLQLCVGSSLAVLVVSPYVRWSYVLLALGEGALLAGHPRASALGQKLHAAAGRRGVVADLQHRWAQALKDDALDDEVLDARGWQIMRCQEHERYGEGGWSLEHLDGHDPPAWTAEGGSPVEGPKSIQPPHDFKWVPQEGWSIEFRQGCDAEGWSIVGPAALGPSLRRRWWQRRAYGAAAPSGPQNAAEEG